MAKICPINAITTRPLCNSECAWYIDGECAVTRLAVASYDKEMKARFIARYMPNMAYGTLKANYKDTGKVCKKTAFTMQNEGWCDDCTANVAECIKRGVCQGYDKEETDAD